MKRLRFILALELFLATTGVESTQLNGVHVVNNTRKHRGNVSDFFFNQEKDDCRSCPGNDRPRPFHDFCNCLVYISTTLLLMQGDNNSNFKSTTYRFLLHLIQKHGMIEAISSTTSLHFLKSARSISRGSFSRLNEISSKLQKCVQSVIVNECNEWETTTEKVGSEKWCPTKDKGYSWIFRGVRDIPPTQNETFPIELMDIYFKDVRNNAPISQLMRYEWARYETYKNFPQESPVMPTRLAQNGFYFTGCFDEVKCFSCGVTYRGWNEGDIVSEVHEHISPGCRHVTRADQSNAPIHEDLHFHPHLDDANIEQDGEQNGATDTIRDLTNTLNSGSNPGYYRSSEQETSCAVSSTRSAASFKHPDLADKEYRLDTFETWQDSDKHDVNTIAEAGFFLSGQCLRCFSCDVSVLCNLENVSSLATVHYPSCPYIQQLQDYQSNETTLETENVSQNQTELPNEARGTNFERHAINTTQQQSGYGHAYNNCDSIPRNVDNLSNHSHERLTSSPCTVSDSPCTVFDSPRTMSGSRRTVSDSPNTVSDSPRSMSDSPRNASRSHCNVSDSSCTVSDRGTVKRRVDDIPKMTMEDVKNVMEKMTELGFKKEQIQSAVANLQFRGDKVDTESVLDILLSEGDDTQKEDTFHNENKKNETIIEQDPQKAIEEFTRMKQQLTCKICLDQEACMVIIPCGHLCTCVTCTMNVRKCPICRNLIRRVIRTST